MKNKISSFLCIVSIFALTSCEKVDYQKNIEEMSLMELNELNESLTHQLDELISYNNELKDISENKTEDEIIELINYVNNEVIKSNVMITSESKSFFHGSSISSGSGTIIKEDENFYYVLTNNHVIYTLGNKTSYYIYDYLNNEYSASVMFCDPNYDMALLKFSKNTLAPLRVSKIAIKDANVSDNIIAIGQPLGKRNAITFGEVLKYEVISCSDCNQYSSNISYECVYYDAPTTNGNSGGMLINYNYELVGVVTYGLNANNGEYLYGAGSPSSKIKEFLNNNNFEVGDDND